ncbi:MAG: UDP-N-acetylglucosamine 1-carboxyvinyltransferase [Bdellovibrio sp.]|nr:UDP-N-acetylglucosamine 1-carboxyvinyltransferase [Bdellovibrio sp.]
MDKIKIRGGNSLSGVVEVSGSKNAALPILFSSVLTDELCVYKRVPDLQDIHSTLVLLKYLNIDCEFKSEQHEAQLKANCVNKHEAPYDLVRKMRASVVVLGPLLAKYGKAKVSLPGGCAIGARPINYHLSGLEKLGAKIQLENGYVIASCKRLRGTRVCLEFPSVGATENIMMAATLAKGETVIENTAREPEISDLACALRAMGAQIEGDGTERIFVQGQTSLHGCQYQIMGDRIEAGTYLAAALATKGCIEVTGINTKHLEAVLKKLEKTGAQIERKENAVLLRSPKKLKSVNIVTSPFPGFPTDMQAQFMVIMAIANGISHIKETIFENRFMHVPELIRLGANIIIDGNMAIIHGVKNLIGAPLMATDLRASASLIIGALCAEGESIVNRIYHLDRGYEKMEIKLRALGADIERIL